MAVNTSDRSSGDNTRGNNFAAQTPPPEEQHFQHAPFDSATTSFQTQEDTRVSFSSIVGNSPLMMTSSMGGESLIALKNTIEKILKDNPPAGMTIKCHPIDRVTAGRMYYSTLVLCVKLATSPSVISYHALIDESSNADYPPEVKMVGQTKIEVLMPSALSYDRFMVNKIRETLLQAYPDIGLLNSTATVVPRGFDHQNELSVRALLSSAVNACLVKLQSHSGELINLDFSKIKADSGFKITPNFSRADGSEEIARFDCVGNPIRSDASAVLMNHPPRREKEERTMNKGNGPTVVAMASGFVEAEWSKPSAQQIQNAMMMNNMANMQPGMINNLAACYTPNFVITDVFGGFNYSLNTTLLGIYSALCMRENNRWMNAFRPSPDQLAGQSRIDVRNVGGLNVLARRPTAAGQTVGEYGDIIPIHSSDFATNDFFTYMNSIFIQNNFLVSLDCPLYGSHSWVTEVFSAAAAGRESAKQDIIKAANSLTGGIFGKKFNANNPMFLRRMRVHSGTMKMGGKLRDIREIDLTYISNVIGASNPSLVHDWLDTFYNDNYDHDQRMWARMGMLKAFSENTAKFNGYFDRVTISGYFMVALHESLREAGFSPAINDAMNNTDYGTIRRSADFAAGGVSFQGNMFNTGQSNASNYGYSGAMYG
jgi:hypothetical protein